MRSPFLLQAFRPDNKLYQRVLKIYFELEANEFWLTRHYETQNLENLKPSAAAYINI